MTATRLKPLPLERFHYVQPPHYTIREAFIDYGHDRLIRRGKDVLRPWIGYNNLFHVIPPEHAVEKITSAQIEDYVRWRMETAGSLLTPKRELTFVKASFIYAHRRNRTGLVPYFEIPEAECAFRRPLTDEEYKLVMRQPMTGRLKRFYRLAYFTGHRAEAIEELTWSRVDFQRLTINFNVPGRRLTNKRRNAAFPIPDEFIETLQGWKAMAKDEFVIGAGGTTYPEAHRVVRELAGITDPTVVPRHCMRKFFATRLFEAQADPEKVALLIADRADMLRKHYVTFSDSSMREVANIGAR